MKKAITQNKVLLTFVGTNDAGNLVDKPDGAILTALQNEKFDEVILLWNEADLGSIKYSDVLLNLKREIKKRKLAKKIIDFEFELKDVTNHNEIYKQLKDFTDDLKKDGSIIYSAAISSGTPSMQACWILLAESGDFSEKHPLRPIKILDPKFGASKNIEVKLDSGLPKIVGLKKEVDTLKNDLIPKCEITISTGFIKIGDIFIELAPMQFSYYRYFVERVINGEQMEKFAGFYAPKHFVKSVHDYHKVSFPFLDTYRESLRELILHNEDLVMSNVRPNITKLNKKLKEALVNESICSAFRISDKGRRGEKFYGIKATADKFQIVKQ